MWPLDFSKYLIIFASFACVPPSATSDETQLIAQTPYENVPNTNPSSPSNSPPVVVTQPKKPDIDKNNSVKIQSVSISLAHTCVVLSSGSVRCFGSGANGQLGYGNLNNIGDDELPYTAGNVDVGAKISTMALGGLHTCALLTNGRVRCWGFNSSGQLGYGNTNNIGDDETPRTAGDIDVGGLVTQISAGAQHTCALLEDGTVRCWGNNAAGKLGYGHTNNIGDNEVPSSVAVVDVGATVIQIEAADFHTCALLSGGNVRCWGSGFSGQLGYGNTNNIGDNENPSSAGDVSIGGTAIRIAAKGSVSCALLDNGTVRCWGSNQFGQLGLGNTNNIGDNEIPAQQPVINLGGTAIDITAGGPKNCALLDTQKVLCFGAGSFYPLGYGNTNNIGDNEDPASVGDIDVGANVSQLSGGNGTHTCVLTTQKKTAMLGYEFIW